MADTVECPQGRKNLLSSCIVAIVVLGSLIYGVHRIAVYPVLYRLMLWSVYGKLSTPASCQWLVCVPWGTLTTQEIGLEKKAASLSEQVRNRFVGWASEIHLLYIALELALYSRWCPGWPVGGFYRDWLIIATLLLGLALVWAWDRQLLLTERWTFAG